jgi:hypothetical protein
MNDRGYRLAALTLPVAVMSTGLLACADANGSSIIDSDITPAAGTFSAFFSQSRSVVPSVPAAEPIVRLSAIDWRKDGWFAIGDASEGSVKLFDSTGRLVRVLGRKGDGPGEFRTPRQVRFGPDNKIHVYDASAERLSVFSASGEYIKTVKTGFGYVSSLEPLPNGGYLFATISETDPNVLQISDSTGTVSTRLLPIRDVRPLDQPEAYPWRSLRMFYMGLRGDTAFVVSSLADTLWRVVLSTRAVVRTRLKVPGMMAPFIPKEGIGRGPVGLRDWAGSFHMPTGMFVDENHIVIPFVKGVLNYGDPMILVWQGPKSPWRALSGITATVGLGPAGIAAITDPEADNLSLTYYRAK